MIRRFALAALALFVLAPLAASAKTSDATVKTKIEAAVKLLEGMAKKADKDTKLQATFRTGVIALRAAQAARTQGKVDDGLALANAGHAAAENKSPPSLASLEKSHGSYIKPSVSAVSSDWGKLAKDWKKMGYLLPENILKPHETIPDTIMRGK